MREDASPVREPVKATMVNSDTKGKTEERPQNRNKIPTPKMGRIDRKALALPADGDFLFRFAVYGDNQRGIAVHGRIVEAILLSGAEVVLHVGDYVKDGRADEQWEEQFRIPARPLLEKAVFLGVPGNHDKDSRRYYEIIKPPGGKSWFAVEHRSVAFFGIDTNKNLRPQGEQGRWLKDALGGCGDRWKVIFLHEAPYSSSWPWPGGAMKTRRHVMPLLEQHGVDLVFAGHIHNYERFHKDGIPYIITGGGGDTLSKPEQLENPHKVWTAMMHNFCTADVYRDRIVVLARDTRGVPFDGLTVEKGGKLVEMKMPARRGYTGPRPAKFPKLVFRGRRRGRG